MHGDVEAAEMEELQHLRVGQQRLEIGRARLPPGDPHEIGVAVAARELHEAQPVAMRIEAEGLGVDGDDGPEIGAVRQIALVQADGHRFGCSAGV